MTGAFPRGLIRTMVSNDTLRALVDAVTADVPRLSRQLIDSIGACVQQTRHVLLRDGWARRRKRFQLEFETSLQPRLAQARRGIDPFRPKEVALHQLSLVDEHQALMDVGVNHAAKHCQEPFSNELYQLNTFFSALAGVQHGREPNWLRPTLFAQAMAEALAGNDLSAEQHYAFMQLASPALAEALAPLYQSLMAVLQEHKVAQLLTTAPTPRAPSTSLADLQERAEFTRQRDAVTTVLPGQRDRGLLSQIYQRLLTDPTLSAPVKGSLSKFQVALERLSLVDEKLLQDQQHPAWRLINAVAAYGSTFTNPGDHRLADFLAFLEEQTSALLNAPALSSQHFEGLRRLIDAFIARQVRASTVQPSAAELTKLARRKQRASWTSLVRDQLKAQLAGIAVSRSLRRFLTDTWVDAIVHSMVEHGEDSELAQSQIHLVDELIDSLMPLPDQAARDELRGRLPSLIRRLEIGLQSIQLAPEQSRDFFTELMALHGRVLSGKGLGVPTQSPVDAPESRYARDSRLDPESSLQSVLAERHSEFGSVWATADVDRTLLPTQPQALQAGESLRPDQAWIASLHIGHWLHLMAHGQWRTTQLGWISEDGEFYLFVGQDEAERQSITRGALRQLYRSGLAINLEQEGAVERAIHALMQDLP